ncbi:hypothetical protein BIW11_05047 [Tropilaelaps mercedesae]|uniref:C2H2-type domain-containing protein n=1 Tax=Tropilaelaps mercedesae TaxID=418985 RepID=A0A1V9WY10_9ACAR|nr:hypothetical protein BIW11_05047 [Tropilaelaps mercedesae]
MRDYPDLSALMAQSSTTGGGGSGSSDKRKQPRGAIRRPHWPPKMLRCEFCDFTTDKKLFLDVHQRKTHRDLKSFKKDDREICWNWKVELEGSHENLKNFLFVAGRHRVR